MQCVLSIFNLYINITIFLSPLQSLNCEPLQLINSFFRQKIRGHQAENTKKYQFFYLHYNFILYTNFNFIITFYVIISLLYEYYKEAKTLKIDWF